jgi:hypothetical protein
VFCHEAADFFEYVMLQNWNLAFAVPSLPGLAMAEPLRLADVIPLFTIPTKATDEVSEDVSTRLPFAPTVMQGAAMERGIPQGARVPEWVASSTATSDGDWPDLPRPQGWA